MRIPFPLDECDCGHYRISHNSDTSVNETTCNACKCSGFKLKMTNEIGEKVTTIDWGED
jgi:hypothetical protein